MKILDQYGLEIAIPSPDDTELTSDVMISRGKSRFVDAIHVPNAVLRSSEESLIELQNSEGGMFCEQKSNTSTQETGATRVFTSN